MDKICNICYKNEKAHSFSHLGLYMEVEYGYSCNLKKYQ